MKLPAKLCWLQLDTTVEIAEGKLTGSAEFRFVNEGTDPETFIQLTTDCDCTTPTVAKRTYGPGEEGLLRVEVELGEESGSSHKRIHVTTSSEPNQPVVLTVAVKVPELMTITPTVLLWDPANPSATKAFTIEIHQPNLRVESVSAESPSVTTNLIQLSDRRYSIELKVADGASPDGINVRIHASREEHRISRTATLILR